MYLIVTMYMTYDDDLFAPPVKVFFAFNTIHVVTTSIFHNDIAAVRAPHGLLVIQHVL